MNDPFATVLDCNGRALVLDRPRVVGIVNVTPDSFSDGGQHDSLDAAYAHALKLVEEGADMLDIGGESTRPGADDVSVEDEIRRVVPLIERLAAATTVPLSIDTSKSEVMRAAVGAGAGMINDVYALRREGALDTAAELRVPVCLMHMQGEPRRMQDAPDYDDVVGDVHRFLTDRLFSCELAGIDKRRVLVDPGFGFGKNLEHNLALLRAMARFAELGAGAYAGVSRKSMIGAMTGRTDPAARVHGSVAAALIAVQRGAILVRVHDVAPTVDALAVWAAVKAGDTAPRIDKPSMPRWPDDD
ncbi:dihydropteroate synthase [Luteibacter rhizovicinus DSM 16549]|uniref:Dihydropteroate synthase n=1 Tax=Luteibacter rhizovicinus DSM 16549 TaxID=1440763 RepID=A0A0G9H282_9GAMM|nr:dihydropteroate synthase [Luteibacter rhizovicinus]APG06000.1 dihydropteroate synthase [Luteibacter rhizovicinus DSM 16549]KLD63965.1 dihydropteroate synthase [Luteibacter rhizovicinus DSM 16549]